MITAEQLLNDPKYREMNDDEILAEIAKMRINRSEYNKLMSLTLSDYVLLNSGLSAPDIVRHYWKSHPLKLKQMRKEDIKHPMILVLRDGSRNYVIPSRKFGWTASDKNNDHVIGSKYREDLTEKYGLTALDIMSVIDWDGTVLWERGKKKYLVGIAEMDDNMELHSVSARKS